MASTVLKSIDVKTAGDQDIWAFRAVLGIAGSTMPLNECG
jgi:hypothetical protein